ncbi:hypothetical protein LX32DRAFT_652645 [Colletotrichum zoysiae]|uniref:Uncharacterized protein n=1 Tax=Colletotrichum zoysiae TaxID=1216348 RepID=A0AAD9HH64_9PEZI|nr:hypothetical protein LX32DRAFT_652645 [Colletotrichum zoysiae]
MAEAYPGQAGPGFWAPRMTRMCSGFCITTLANPQSRVSREPEKVLQTSDTKLSGGLHCCGAERTDPKHKGPSANSLLLERHSEDVAESFRDGTQAELATAQVEIFQSLPLFGLEIHSVSRKWARL